MLLILSIGCTDNHNEIGPDRILFTAGSSDEIHIMNLEGDFKNIDPFPGETNQHPRWSPDGKKIIFSTYIEATTLGSWIYTADTDGSDPEPAGAFLVGSFPSWSPDGEKIVYTFCPDCGSYQLYVFYRDSGVRKLQTFTSTNWDPDWSPDGTRIVFTSDRDRPLPGMVTFELYTIDSSGANTTRITADSAVGHYCPRWIDDNSIVSILRYVKSMDTYQYRLVKYTLTPPSADTLFLPNGYQFLTPTSMNNGSSIAVSNRNRNVIVTVLDSVKGVQAALVLDKDGNFLRYVEIPQLPRFWLSDWYEKD